jgi:hypothetical protein
MPIVPSFIEENINFSPKNPKPQNFTMKKGPKKPKPKNFTAWQIENSRQNR